MTSDDSLRDDRRSNEDGNYALGSSESAPPPEPGPHVPNDGGHGDAPLDLFDRGVLMRQEVDDLHTAISTITDAASRHAVERALRESERRSRLITDNINDIVVLADLNFTHRYVSLAAAAILGHNPADLVGGHPSDLLHPDDLEGWLCVCKDLASGRRERGLTTLRCRHQDGHWVWLEVSSRLVVDPKTECPSGILSTMRDVTARKLAQDRLRFSEARHRALVDSLPQMLVIMSAETGEASHTNVQFKGYFGPIGPSRDARAALIHPDDLDRHKEIWVNARARQGRYQGEVRLRRRDGVFRWHRMVMVPVVQDGAIGDVIGTALDIDELVTAKRDLERTTDLLRMAQAAAGAGAWEWDPATDQMRLSPASARLHGLPAAESDAPTVVSLEAWKARIVPEDRPAVTVAIERDRREWLFSGHEFRTLTPDLPGGQRWVQALGHIVRDAERTRFVGLHLDVTERREADEALRTREAQLRISEERLTLALDSGDDGLFDADFEQNTHWVSQRWVERLGYGAEASHWPRAVWWDMIHPDDFGQLTAEMKAHELGTSPGVEHEHRLRRADGSYVWVLTRARAVARNAAGKPLRVVGTLIDISQRKEAEMRIRHMAEHDALTGLPNRRVVDDRLAEAVERTGTEPGRDAVLVCDIDHFKLINDTLGHLTGDRILCATAVRIQSAVRSGDLVARLGGDEFAVLLTNIDGREGAALAAARIIDALKEPMEADGAPIRVGISIGAAVLTDDGARAEEVFKRADVALYEAKAGGRNTFRLFEAETHAKATKRGLLALDMPNAMQRGEFFLVYQPITDIATGVASSCEALMRWRRPDRGLISPGEFIPVAEDTGAIVPLGAWALVEACREAALWPDAVQVAVNVSTQQLSRDIEGSVRKALDLAQLRPDRLVIEVTESALFNDPDQARRILGRLKDLGVLIALDDFGTGYSSLSYLRLFPFDKLKIDRSFIRDIADPNAAAIVRAVVGIGERLGMSVVAEGVETPEQLELVRREGCRQIQGFLFSRPLPSLEARAFLEAQA